jgi:hypothetical protein
MAQAFAVFMPWGYPNDMFGSCIALREAWVRPPHLYILIRCLAPHGGT